MIALVFWKLPHPIPLPVSYLTHKLSLGICAFAGAVQNASFRTCFCGQESLVEVVRAPVQIVVFVKPVPYEYSVHPRKISECHPSIRWTAIALGNLIGHKTCQTTS